MGIDWRPDYTDYDSVERDVPLSFKYEALALPDVFEVGRTGVAMKLAVFEAHMLTNRPMSYSRSCDFYAKRKRHPLGGYRVVKRGADHLAAKDAIIHFKQQPGGRGWQSSMMPSPLLLDVMPKLLASAPRLKIARPVETILLRDAAGFDCDVRHCREVERMNRKVEAINEAITSTDVRSHSGDNLTAPVVRIFNVAPMLTRGGRLYARGTSWQNISCEDRQRVKIDDEAVVEIDYRTLHPAMLYAETGAVLPSDCYAINGWPRDLVKLAMLILINAPNEASARRALAYKAAELLNLANHGEGMSVAAQVIEDVKRVHRPIARFFHSDAGARLMRNDSDLAVTVMSNLLKEGIVALPVHDSFLVPASKADALEGAMMRAAHAAGLRDLKVEAV